MAEAISDEQLQWHIIKSIKAPLDEALNNINKNLSDDDKIGRDIKLFVKGGYSVWHHLQEHAPETYDIDISPLFHADGLTTAQYVELAQNINIKFYDYLTMALSNPTHADNLSKAFRGKSVNLRRDDPVNGLIKVYATWEGYQEVHIIDLSYIDPNDEDSFFVECIKEQGTDFNTFAEIEAFDKGSIYTDLAFERCVAKHGLERQLEYLEASKTWGLRAEEFRKMIVEENENIIKYNEAIDKANIEGLELQAQFNRLEEEIKKLNEIYSNMKNQIVSSQPTLEQHAQMMDVKRKGDDMILHKKSLIDQMQDRQNIIDFCNRHKAESVRNIEMYTRMAETLERQASPAYIEKLKNKAKRYAKKIDIITPHVRPGAL